MKPRVFVTRDLPGEALRGLEEIADVDVWQGRGAPDPAELRRRSSAAAGLLCLLTDRIDEALLAAAPSLRVISSCSVGLDHVDLEACSARGIPVGHTPGVLTETTAEFAFALLLASARRVPEADRFVRTGAWTPPRRWEPDMLLGVDLHGATLGIVGLGPIGRAVAFRARAFGMRVLAWSRTRRELEGVEHTTLDELLGLSDFVSVHVALTDDTRDLIGAREIARMKPGAVLVNTARGGIVDEVALASALGSGQLRSAGLDVFESEPLDPSSPLLGLDNVVLAPHIGSASERTRARMASLAVENLEAGLLGRRLPRCANPAVDSGTELEKGAGR